MYRGSEKFMTLFLKYCINIMRNEEEQESKKDNVNWKRIDKTTRKKKK
jgi:hypothetical protein